MAPCSTRFLPRQQQEHASASGRARYWVHCPASGSSSFPNQWGISMNPIPAREPDFATHESFPGGLPRYAAVESGVRLALLAGARAPLRSFHSFSNMTTPSEDWENGSSAIVRRRSACGPSSTDSVQSVHPWSRGFGLLSAIGGCCKLGDQSDACRTEATATVSLRRPLQCCAMPSQGKRTWARGGLP